MPNKPVNDLDPDALRRVIGQLLLQKGVDIREIQRGLPIMVPKRTLQRHLNKLVEQELLYVTGNGRGTRYCLQQPEPATARSDSVSTAEEERLSKEGMRQFRAMAADPSPKADTVPVVNAAPKPAPPAAAGKAPPPVACADAPAQGVEALRRQVYEQLRASGYTEEQCRITADAWAKSAAQYAQPEEAKK